MMKSQRRRRVLRGMMVVAAVASTGLVAAGVGSRGWLAVPVSAAPSSPASAASPAPTAAPVAAATNTLAVAGRANANVSLASVGTTVAATWSAALPDGTTDVFAAVSRDGGVTFGAPVRVNQKPGDARVNGEQPARVTLAARGSGAPAITVIWTSKAQTGTVLQTSTSTDGGKTFTPSALVPGTDVAGNRGWEAIGADASGAVHAVWLDHRRMAAPDASKAAAAHKHGEGGGATMAAKPDGVAMAQQSDLYFDTITDAAAPRAITPGVCYCCKTAIAFGKPGQIFLAWRHVYPGNFRDMAFALSNDGGRTFSSPIRVSQDNWMLEGCPDDGPAMKVDAAGRIHITWPAVVSEKGTQTKAIFYAMSTDGKAFQPRVRIPTEGQANHPQLVLGANGALRLAWDEAASGSRRIVTGAGQIDASGKVAFTRTALEGEVGVYPVLAATSAGTVVAWTTGAPDASTIKLVRLP